MVSMGLKSPEGAVRNLRCPSGSGFQFRIQTQTLGDLCLALTHLQPQGTLSKESLYLKAGVRSDSIHTRHGRSACVTHLAQGRARG